MGDVLDNPVLALNKHFQPLRIVTVRRALVLVFGDAAHALDENNDAYDWRAWAELSVRAEDDAIGLVSHRVRAPRIIQCTRYARLPRVGVRLSRENVFLRDDYRCQYCRRTFVSRELNLDHVVPRSRGGATTWENLVTSCHACNRRKGRALPEECGMAPLEKPKRPTLSTMPSLHGIVRRYPEWDAFLG